MSCNWPQVSLREAGVTLIDCDHKTPKAQDQGLPYVGIPQLKDGRISLEGARLISEDDFHKWRRKAKPQSDDVILSRRCNPGESAYVPEGLEIALGQNLVLLRSDGSGVYPPFLRWLTQGPYWWSQVSTFLNVGAVFDSLKCADIPKFKVPLPPLRVQQNIANILSNLDDKIQLNHQINQTLEQMAQAIFKSWFVDFEPVKVKIAARERWHALQLGNESASPACYAGELADQPINIDLDTYMNHAAMHAISGKDAEQLALMQVEKPEKYAELYATAELFPSAMQDSELGEIPEGWEAFPLYNTAEYVNGAAFTAKDFTDNDSGLPIIKIAELKQGITGTTKFTTRHLTEKYRINTGDVLYSWSGSPETSLEVFKWFGGEGWLNQHIFKLSFNSSQNIHFTYFLLKQIKPLLVSTAKQKQTTGLGHITVADMKRIKIPYPRKELMIAFSSLVLPFYDRASEATKESHYLSSLRDTLLPKLLSGELSVADIESEAEA